MANMTIQEYTEQLLRWRREADFELAKEQRNKQERDGRKDAIRKALCRSGKTYRDRESGAHARNEANKSARREWNNTPSGKRTHANFPWGSCNGKRNRSRVTGRGGSTIHLDVQIHPSMR